MEDIQIIKLFLGRSERAISELDGKYGRLCQQVAGNILNNFSDAEECVNDAYLGVWNTIPPKNPESLIGYTLKIVRNLSIKKFHYNTAIKRNSNYEMSLEEIDDCIATLKDVETEIEGKELKETIEHFLDELNQTDRVIFMRRYYFSDSYKDIASLIGITEKNVSVRLTRLRSNMKEYLNERGYGI